METFDGLLLGFGVVLTPINLGYAFLGCLIGTVIGVLPGIGPVSTLAVLLPITFTMPPASALIMLSAIYYGAQYGGSATSILVRLPGESASVVTCLDGYEMARQGRAGPALAIAAIGSLIAGCIATVVIALFAPLLSKFALSFNSPDYFSLMILGLIAAVVLSQGSLAKSIAMILVGILFGLVGTDVTSGITRYTIGVPQLFDGLDFSVLAVGLFALSELIVNLERGKGKEGDPIPVPNFWSLMPTLADLRATLLPILRGTGIGCFFGSLPGGGATISSFAAYAVEVKLARDPSRFGKGAIEGVAAPEAANNAGAQAAFIPMLTLGIPSNAVTALLLGALLIQGITPGPLFIVKNPDLFWGVIASMYIGNLILVILNLPLIGIWVRLLQIPYKYMFPAIILFASIGVYSINNEPVDLFVTAFFGVIGWAFVRLECPSAPLLLGFVLGPLMEENFRRSLLSSSGSPAIFLERPISLSFLIFSVILLVLVLVPYLRTKRDEAFVVEE